MNNIDKTNKFIKKCKEVHGDKYDYSKVEYINAKLKVCIICYIHGEFSQTPNDHLNGKGCPKCGKVQQVAKQSYNTFTFIERAKEVHGDKYDYSKVNYVNSITKVCIICPIHGEFWQRATSHLSGKGCAKCGNLSISDKNSSNTSEFIKKANEIHNNKYDYSNVKYTNTQNKICIICPIHGEFWQLPSGHLSGHGCPKCHLNKKTSNTSDFIERAKEVHGDKYDYSKVEYVSALNKVIIICPIHGEFEQRASHHLNDVGCPQCAITSKTSNTTDFIIKAKEIHKDKYDYSKVKYINTNTKVCIVCSIHGEFFQRPRVHLNGCSCPKCGIEAITSNTSEFIIKAKEVHGDKYDYSQVKYINAINKINIICPKHGEFLQTPYNHIIGHGCSKCRCINSKAEEEISNYVTTLGLEVVRGNRKILNGLELDMLVPSKNIAIEYNGLHWHSEELGKDKYYHLNKTLECKKQGINLIHIFEDEYLERKEVVLNKLKHILGVSEELTKIMGRKCIVEEVDTKTAMDFLNEYHIQGYGSSTVHLGAVYGNELIAVMSFKKESKESLKWELTRFASNIHYVCQGIGGKLFQHFLKTYNPSEVKSFADRRWTLNEESNVYTKLGFVLDSVLPPEYRYVVGDKRKHKFGFRKQILHKKYGLSLDMTESEMVSELGFSKIWDCGLLKYVWENKETK